MSASAAPSGDGSRAAVVAAAALIGFALAYAVPVVLGSSNLVYDPLARRFLVAARPAALLMGYYGQLLHGLVGALALGLLAGLVVARRRRPPAPATTSLLSAWALTLLALVGAYFTWQNWP